jgi:hypothetical protein
MKRVMFVVAFAARFGDDRLAYAEAEAGFVEKALKRARQEKEGRKS